MIYYCIEAPCCQQENVPILKLFVNRDRGRFAHWKCPMCEQLYSQETLDKISSVKNAHRHRL
jgi:transposase-like protein